LLDFSQLAGISRETLGSVGSFFGLGVVTTDEQGRALTVNAQWERWVGPSAASHAWQSAFADPNVIEECLHTARAQGHASAQCRLAQPAHHPMWMHVRVFRLDGSNGQFDGFVVGATDISDLHQVTEKFERAALSTIEALSSMEAVRDLHTAGHQERVGRLAEAIGAELQVPEESRPGLRIAAVLHDVGKIGTPIPILTKPAPLSYGEYALVREHAVNGYGILKGVTADWPLARVAHEHHERLNGSGYPQGLRGDQILLEARIIAVADVVESMAVDRPYRRGLGAAAALEEIHGNRGILYDPDSVAACITVVESGFDLQATRHLQGRVDP
jgi:HD-GYP domain-containing protein (c-di-GMP phosphodiesterase class II)